MSDATDAQSTFTLKLEGDAGEAADGVADSLESLQEKIYGSEQSIKNMSGTLRRLRGDSDDVKAAKLELTAQITAERAAVSTAALAIQQQGTSYQALADETKKLTKAKEELQKKNEAKALAEEQKGIANVTGAAKGADGPLGSLFGRFSELAEMAGGAGGAMAIATIGIAAFTAGVLAATVAVVGIVAAIARWALVQADANAALNLDRQAVTGSAEDATRLGRQVDLLASKVPTATAELNKMGVELRRNGIMGQTLVDTLDAEAQASSALGDAAGSKVKELVERSRMSKRFSVNPIELIGSGLKFDDIAKSLAKATGKGVQDAKKALVEGRVTMAQGAAALRDTIDQKFGDINLAKMLSFDNIVGTFKKQFDLFTRGIDLKPAYAGVKSIVDLFGQGSVTGQALKGIVGDIGNGLIKTFSENVENIKQFIKGLVIGALEIELAYYTVKKSFKEAFGDADILKNIDVAETTVTALKVAVYGTAAALVLLGTAAAAAFIIIGAPAITGAAAIYGIYEAGKWVYDWFAKTDWSGIGTSIIDGLISGISSGVQRVTDVAASLGTSIKDAFKSELGIHSPSVVMAEQGYNVSAGAAVGIESGTPMVAQAVASMAATANMGAPSSGAAPCARAQGATGAGIVVNITVEGNSDAKTEAVLSSQSFYAKLVVALEEAQASMMTPAGG